MNEAFPKNTIKPGIMPRIGVLINPNSGGNKNGLTAIRRTIAQYPRISHCDVRRPPEVLAALEDFARRGVELVMSTAETAPCRLF